MELPGQSQPTWVSDLIVITVYKTKSHPADAGGGGVRRRQRTVSVPRTKASLFGHMRPTLPLIFADIDHVQI
ncbi:hypothetical protein EYF80_020940 [Liparis tanakae]|uniref:Uncharacterized protein n=1 Tax=Liparis tanakae TaxID=230148 RepID=A0A4Z2HUA7_9TELE|nr:hypothetical protein EYF80_020940 [Liparis tanakae]